MSLLVKEFWSRLKLLQESPSITDKSERVFAPRTRSQAIARKDSQLYCLTV